MLLIIGAVLSAGCLIVTINLYNVFKKGPPYLNWIAKLIEINPLFSFSFNLAVSTMLTAFIGAGMISGAANLLASILFAIYIEVVGKKKTIAKGKSFLNSNSNYIKNLLKDKNSISNEQDKFNYNIDDNEKNLIDQDYVEKVGEKIGKSIKFISKIPKKMITQDANKEIKNKFKKFIKGLKNGLKNNNP